MTEAVIIHRIPGRMRIRIPAKRGDAAYFASMAERLRATDGIQDVKANPVTGSIVVRFEQDWEEILDRFREHGLDFRIEVTGGSLHAGRGGFHPVRLVTGRSIDPMFMLGSALAVVGIVQTLRGKVAVPSITAFWYAIDAFRASGKTR